MTIDLLIHLLADNGFAIGYLGEAWNALVNGAPL